MRNSKHLSCADQHTREGSSLCVFLEKSSSYGENFGGESGASCRR